MDKKQSENLESLASCVLEEASQGEPNVNQSGLLTGRAGWALLRAESGGVRDASYEEARLSEDLGRLLEDVNAANIDLSFAFGLAGIATLFELLYPNALADLDKQFNAGVDQLLCQAIGAGSVSEYEFTEGLAGYAVYGARRAVNHNSSKVLDLTVEEFDKRAYRDRCGVTWLTAPDSRYQLQRIPTQGSEVNFGLAHGTMSVLSALLPAIWLSDNRETARELLHSGCEWLIANAQDVDKWGSYFPYGSVQSCKSRIGWCYGDLGAASLFVRAGICLSEERFINFGCSILNHIGERVVKGESGIEDGAICHGSAGVALVARTLKCLVDVPVLDEIESIMVSDMCSRFNRSGLSEFSVGWHRDKQIGRESVSWGLLESPTGAALVAIGLLSGCTKWSDIFLLPGSGVDFRALS